MPNRALERNGAAYEAIRTGDMNIKVKSVQTGTFVSVFWSDAARKYMLYNPNGRNVRLSYFIDVALGKACDAVSAHDNRKEVTDSFFRANRTRTLDNAN